jgi:hypothetical protein
LEIEKNWYHILFGDEHVLFVPRQYNFTSTMILGVRERNLYRLRSHPTHVMTRRRKEIDKEEKVAPLVVRQVALPVAHV